MDEQKPSSAAGERDRDGVRISGTDPDGVRIVEGTGAARRRRIYQGLALFFAAGCVGYIVMPRRTLPPPQEDTARESMPKPIVHMPASGGQDIEETAPAASAPHVEKTGEAAATANAAGSANAPAARPLTPRRLASHKKTDAPPDGEDPTRDRDIPPIARDVTAAEYIQALHDAGIHEGIGAFNPPGTSPPMDGLAVPDDYELPEGYVRHYQTTDDGQRIDPILMYSPDYEFFDANGNPVPIPDNRVVPPENAPPGFPINPVVIPPPRQRDPGNLGR